MRGRVAARKAASEARLNVLIDGEDRYVAGEMSDVEDEGGLAGDRNVSAVHRGG